MRLRSHLFVLSLAAVLPIVAFSTVISTILVERERETFRRSAMERTRALMTAVDAELRGSIATLLALATSRNLERADLAAFHEEASRVLAAQPTWLNVSLALPSGQQLVNTGRTFGAQLPVVSEMASVERALKTLRPAIGDVSIGLVTQRPGVTVRVPVVHNGAAAYVLTAFVDTDSFGDLLRAQRMPPDWVIAIADSSRRFVARIPRRPAGQPVAPGFNAALLGAPEGWYRAATVEGRDTYQSYSRSAFSGWGVGMAIPAEEFEAIAWRTAGAMTAGAAVSLGLAFLLAIFVGGRIARPIDSLASAARAIGQGAEVELDAPKRVTEVAQLAAALGEAATAIRQREEQQRRAEEALREADRRKDEFLATLAHELRNPLAPLRSALHLQRMSSEGDSAGRLPVARLGEMMERQVDHLVRLVDDLLEVSRISRGAFELRRVRVELASIVRNAIETSEPLIQGAGHQLSVSLPEEPLWIDGDPVRLAQILANLLNNAAKYTGGPGQIWVHAARQGEAVAISVRDNGDGIAPELLARLFEMFTRGDHASRRGPGGLGIGLALSRRLAEMHGGSLNGRSEGPGKGAEFILRLPLAADQRPEPADAKYAEAVIVNRRILVVDDNRDAADSLAMVLASLGAEVRVARDGFEALEALNSYEPSMVLLDIGMPGLDGYEVARAIRKRFPERRTTLVALTGWGQESDRRKAREAGFDHHLVKPVEIGALLAILNSPDVIAANDARGERPFGGGPGKASDAPSQV